MARVSFAPDSLLTPVLRPLQLPTNSDTTQPQLQRNATPQARLTYLQLQLHFHSNSTRHQGQRQIDSKPRQRPARSTTAPILLISY